MLGFKGIEREDARLGAVFLLKMAFAYVLISFTVQQPAFTAAAEMLSAQGALFLLGFAGVEGVITAGEPVLISFENFSAQISYLCTGLMEQAILVAAIIATAGVAWRKKLYGVVAGVAATTAFNFFRIAVTVLVIMNAAQGVAVLAHDVLFRVSIFVEIAVAYIAWYWWAAKKTRTLQA